MSKSLRFVIAISLAIVMLSVGFIGGFLTSSARTPNGESLLSLTGVHGVRSTQTSEELARRVNEVQAILESAGLSPSEIDSATAGAIAGLLTANGDQWAEYRSPELTEENAEMMSGEFGGIGVVLSESEGVVSVLEVYEGTPAEKGDVRVGDVFVSVDGDKRDTWTADAISDIVRGEKGTTVEIVFRRPATPGAAGGDLVTKQLVRDTIVTKNVTSELLEGVGYLRMGSFNGRSTDDLREEIDELEAQGAKALILDLRFNPGGLLNQAVGVASLFVDSGTIVRVEARDGTIEELVAMGIKATDLPLVLLVNENSASASEVLAGALKDYDRATIVGKTTFGKGSVQEVRNLSFGGSIKFTSSHYLSPLGSVIDGVGVSPDVEVEAGEMPHFSLERYKEDAQLMKALEIAKSKR